MLNIYLVRHGETEWNIEHRLQGWKNSSLTDNGVKNARLLGERLKEVDFKKVYSSPSERALHTASLLTTNEIEIVEELKEISFGDWEGKTREEIEKVNAQEYSKFWNEPHLYNHQLNNGESLNSFFKRTENAVKHLVDVNKDGNILVVTHGGTVKALMSYFWKIPVEKLWEPPIIEGASLSLVKWDGEVFHKELLGDTSHIDS